MKGGRLIKGGFCMPSKKTTGKRNTSKRSTSKKNTAKKSTYKSKKKQKEAVKQNGAIQDEIILIITLVVSILIFLSYFDLCGIVGKHVSEFLFGIIGLEAYILPFILFFGTAFYISNMGNKVAVKKLLSAAVFLLALAGLIQMISKPYDSNMKILDYYSNSSKGRSGGGIIGGILAMVLCGAFDETGAYILIIATMIISVILMTGKALFLYMARLSKKSLEDRRQYKMIRKEQYEEQMAKEGLEKPGRRRFKAFNLESEDEEETDIDQDDSNILEILGKKRRRRKKKEVDELPIVNLGELSPHDAKTAADQVNSINLADMKIQGLDEEYVPAYEEELRNKFGNSNSEAAIEKNLDTSNESESSSLSTSVEATMKDNEGTRGKKKAVASDNSTDVENLDINQMAEEKEYVFPPVNLLTAPKARSARGQMTERTLKETAAKLQSTLESFGVHVTVTNVSCGPTVTRYELQPEQGVKVKSITSLADDIKLNLAASEVRIEAPIPGKSAVGIEVPNKENSVVTFRELIESKEFTNHPSDIAFAVGRDIGGQVIITDIAKMPHLLIAGATGSGKSVCINTLIMSILYKSKPSDVRMIMIDPKVVELSVYNGIPHLLIPVVTDPKKAAAALNWAVMEMTDRYKKFAETGVRDLKGYNKKVQEVAHLNDENLQKLPQIVIIIDELADLMMVAPGEVEDAICRLAQMARAAGIHLIIATQRPSVNVITGLIKANIPSRIAFAVSSAVDSRTIIDSAGAEKLLGKGDMLFFPSGYPKPVRIQGSYVSDKEVSATVDFLIQNNNSANYSEEIKETIANVKAAEAAAAAASERDEYFVEAGRFIIEKDKASIGMLQRVYKIGFNRAARIMDQLAEVGVVGPEEGTKPRKILMSAEEYEQFLSDNGLA
jgi:S-DNA-T family DNA segregation ATPase FtsK/SpoIIIE